MNEMQEWLNDNGLVGRICGGAITDWDLDDCETYEVTHWMPLPEPPKN